MKNLLKNALAAVGVLAIALSTKQAFDDRKLHRDVENHLTDANK